MNFDYQFPSFVIIFTVMLVIAVLSKRQHCYNYHV